MSFRDKEAVPLLYVARHGRTILNASGMFRGRANPPLDKTGMQDAHRLAFYFEAVPLSFIVCSDKTRAVTTADIIAKKKSMDFHPTEKLRALDVGDFSGQPRNKENTDKLQYFLDNPDLQIPGGESLSNFRSRINPAIMRAIELADDSGECGLLVAHSSIVHQVGQLLYDNHTSVLVEPGGVLAIYYKNDKLEAEPVLKKVENAPSSKADTIS
jgi:broad specificity phosphatase PhoE